MRRGRLPVAWGGLCRRAASTLEIEHDKHLPDGHHVTDLGAKLGDGPLARGADGDGGLVRHHLDHLLVFGDLVSLLDKPVYDLALGDTLADVGQLELELGHRASSKTQLFAASSIAGRMRCESGRYSISSVYGNGVSNPVTRTGGASRW